MIRFFTKYYFITFLFLALLTYMLQKFQVVLPEIVNNYLNDFLCIPIVLKSGQYIIQYIKSDFNLKIPYALQITVTVFYAIFFEVIVPIFNDRYTGDSLDVVAYFSGLIVYQLLEYLRTTEKDTTTALVI